MARVRMVLKPKSIVEQLAWEAIRLGAGMLEVEYKDGYEEVSAMKGAVGQGIARFRSSSRKAASLRDGHTLSRKKGA